MRTALSKLFWLISFIIHYKTTYSQTITLDYLNSNLNSSACNVFSPSVTINGISHSSHAGGVGFNSTAGLLLSTTPKANPQAGTAFIINYTFISGNKYDISITARGNAALYLKTSVVPNLNQFATNSNSTCTPDPNVSSYNTVGYGQLSTTTATNSVTYNIPQYQIQDNTAYPYFIVWASGGSVSLDLDILEISKIIITKTPIISFTLTPNPISVVCGKSNPVNLTVNNVYNSPGVTGYTWNLGSGNTWIYNGQPAPASINTTGNTLTLFPTCGITPGSIIATVAIGTSNYQTNTATVSSTNETLSISGSNPLCVNSDIYSVQNLPTCGATVTNWSATPSGIVQVTDNGNNTATVTRLANGVVTLTATINKTNACSSGTEIKNLTVTIGTPNTTITARKTSAYGEPTTYEFTATQIPGATYSWYVSGMANNPQQTGSNNTFDWYFPCRVTKTIYCIASNTCGSATSNSISETGECIRGGSYTLSPNPASNTLTISVSNELSSEVSSTFTISEIRIYDQKGNLKKYQKENNVRTSQINIADLKTGFYIVEISDGIYKEQQQLIIQK